MSRLIDCAAVAVAVEVPALGVAACAVPVAATFAGVKVGIGVKAAVGEDTVVEVAMGDIVAEGTEVGCRSATGEGAPANGKPGRFGMHATNPLPRAIAVQSAATLLISDPIVHTPGRGAAAQGGGCA